MCDTTTRGVTHSFGVGGGEGLVKLFDIQDIWQNSIVHSSAQAALSLGFEHWTPKISCRYPEQIVLQIFTQLFAGMIGQFCVLQFQRVSAICV
jgi:hypothetical protein